MAGPLEGLNVLDCGRWMTAPVCARILADLGADVTKVESRGRPDPMRGFADLTAATYTKGDMSAAAAIPNFYFDICNRGKKGIVLDLTKAKGKEILYRLVAGADVVLHNWRSKEAERLGVDFVTLTAYNPRLIYAAISGWGPEGPDAGEPAMDKAAQARAGTMYLWGGPEMPPLSCEGGLADQTTAMVTVEGILAALFARERRGVGQKVDVSLLGAMAALQSQHFQAQLVRGFTISRRDREKASNPLTTHYECADGKWIMLSMYQADRYWPALCKVMGIPELEHDPRFENTLARGQHAEELVAVLDRVFATRPRPEWAKLLADNDLIYALVQTIPEAVDDPQLAANDYVIDFDHSEWGRVRVLGFPYSFSSTPLSLERQAPTYGQHTEEVLLEAGYTWDEIARLKEEEVI